MSRPRPAQLNVRSDFAKDRAQEIARRSGMSTTRVVEEALRAYTPPPLDQPPYGLIEKGGLLVMPSRGRKITRRQLLDAIDAVREERDCSIYPD